MDARRLLSWFRWSGRVRRRTFLFRIAVAAVAFTVGYVFLDHLFGRGATLLLYPPFFAAVLTAGTRRLHDQARSAWWWLAVLVPVVGPLVLALLLCFRRGTVGENQYGDDPRVRGRDYLQVAIHEPA